MPTDQFTRTDLGFEAAWDADLFFGIADPADARLAWAVATVLVEAPAAALLLVAAASAGDPADTCRPPYILLATDGRPSPPEVFATWDWSEVTHRFAAALMRCDGIDVVGVAQYHWHGFPMLTLFLDTVPDWSPANYLGRSVGYLFTPQQTFTLFSDLTGLDDEDVMDALREFFDSFHLIPREREGRREQAHERVRMPFFLHASQASDTGLAG